MMNSKCAPIVIIKGESAKKMRYSLTHKKDIDEDKAYKKAVECLKKAGLFD